MFSVLLFSSENVSVSFEASLLKVLSVCVSLLFSAVFSFELSSSLVYSEEVLSIELLSICTHDDELSLELTEVGAEEETLSFLEEVVVLDSFFLLCESFFFEFASDLLSELVSVCESVSVDD